MMQRIAAAAFIAALLSTPALAQPVPPSGGGGGGSGGATGANPTATASDTAVNGSASTFMRSDAAPAVQKGSATQFGLVKVDGTTITATGGVISASSGSGTVTSVATGAGLTGGPVTTTGTISTTFAIRAVTGTTDTVLSTDAAKLVTYSNAAAIAVTLPQATGSFGAGFATTVQNLGAGLVTITPTTSTVNGAATLTVPTNTGCDLVSDGTNWQIAACSSVAGKFNLTNATNYPTASLTGLGTGVATALASNVSGSGSICLASGSACASINSNWVAGNWYNSFSSAVNTGVNITATVTEWVPIFFDRPVTIGNIGARISTASAGQNMQFAVYAASASTGLPTGSALCTTASISTASTGSFDAACNATGSPTLASAGRYWFGFQVSDATITVVSSTGATALNSVIGASSHANLSGSANNFGTEYKTTGGTFGTWATNPVISQAGASGNTIPLVQFSLTSVP